MDSTFSGVLLRKSRKTGRPAPLLVSEVRLCMAARGTLRLIRNVTCFKTKRVGNTIAVDLMGEVASDFLLIGRAAASRPGGPQRPGA